MNLVGHFVTASLTVGLVLLIAAAWSEVRHAKLRLSTFWLIAALSGALVATTGRLIPGGPFLSIHGDFMPVVGCFAVLVLGAMGFRSIASDLRLVLAFAMVVAAGLIVLVAVNLLSFWKLPFARGALIAW